MTSFAKESFNSAAYAKFRPSYPEQLFQLVFDYHQSKGGNLSGKWEVAVDIGCGTGQATAHLEGVFGKVTGLDISEGMLNIARARFDTTKFMSSKTSFSFEKGDAGDLNKLEDESVDLIISAEACHWFDWKKAWTEMARVLRPGGSAVHWIYAVDFVLPDFHSSVPIIKDYSMALWNYFDRPGWEIVYNMLVDVPEPPKDVGLSVLERRYYCGSNFPPHIPRPHTSQIHPMIMSKDMRWRDLLALLRTWSGLHNYHEKVPEDLNRVDKRFPEDIVEVERYEDVNNSGIPLDTCRSGAQVAVDMSGGDIAIRFWKDLREEVKKAGGKYGVNDFVRVEWPVTMLLVKKLT